jgi:hypothetical protein
MRQLTKRQAREMSQSSRAFGMARAGCAAMARTTRGRKTTHGTGAARFAARLGNADAEIAEGLAEYEAGKGA